MDAGEALPPSRGPDGIGRSMRIEPLPPAAQLGDWRCPICNNHNFANRVVMCNRCERTPRQQCFAHPRNHHVATTFLI